MNMVLDVLIKEIMGGNTTLNEDQLRSALMIRTTNVECSVSGTNNGMLTYWTITLISGLNNMTSSEMLSNYDESIENGKIVIKSKEEIASILEKTASANGPEPNRFTGFLKHMEDENG